MGGQLSKSSYIKEVIPPFHWIRKLIGRSIVESGQTDISAGDPLPWTLDNDDFFSWFFHSELQTRLALNECLGLKCGLEFRDLQIARLARRCLFLKDPDILLDTLIPDRK